MASLPPAGASGTRRHADGYVEGVEYVATYTPTLDPHRIGFAAAMAGYENPAGHPGFAYMEVGCGVGVTACVLAAANPVARFRAIDRDRGHIEAARRLAGAAGLGNIEFVATAVEDLAGTASEEFDFVTLHGLYSWVGRRTRESIRELLARSLRPGGLAHVSYNCHPGWSQIEPLHRLVRDIAESEPGSPLERIEAAVARVEALNAADAAYFTRNPRARRMLRRMRDSATDRRYLAHEFLNGEWEVLYHADVSRQMAEAGFDYVGSARIAENIDDLVFSEAMTREREAVSDPALVEWLRDLALNRAFRTDIYRKSGTWAPARDARPPADATAFPWPCPRFALVGSIPDVVGETGVEATVSTGRHHVPAERCAPLLKALSTGPQPLDALVGNEAIRGRGQHDVLDTLQRLVALGHVAPIPGEASQDAARTTTRRLNAVEPRPDLVRGERVLASPVLGAGVVLDADESAMLDDLDPEGESGPSVAPTERAMAFVRDRLPILRMLGVA